MKISTYQDMEELRRRLFDSIDIVIERDYIVIDQLTKLEIQAKILALQIIAPESILTVLQIHIFLYHQTYKKYLIVLQKSK